jgi:hypothetical protein
MVHDCPNKPIAAGYPLRSAVADAATQRETLLITIPIRLRKYVSKEVDIGPLPGSSPVFSAMLANTHSISTTAVNVIAIPKGSMDGNHLIVMCAISLDTKDIPTHALIDRGATGYAFID